MIKHCSLLLLVLLSSAAYAADKSGVHWPSFRGALARGVAEGYPTPTKWNVPKRENITWKTAIPGLGHSCPVIWGDLIYVTTAISGKEDPKLKVGLYGNIMPVDDNTVHRWCLYCLDKRSGKILWERTAYEGAPTIKRHPKATHANSTPVTDGKHVVAFFGSEGLYCFDTQGKLLWQRDLGLLDSGYYVVPPAQWGFGSSPIIHDNMVIVQCDVQNDSFIAAFDITNGRKIWDTPRKDVPTWGTPTIYQSGDRAQVIVNGYKHIGGYDVTTGKAVWRLEGGGDIPVPTPVVAHDLIFITSAHGGLAPIYAIRTSAAGDISLDEGATENKHIAWSDTRGGNYMQTPLVYGDELYCCRDNGTLTCFDAKTGKTCYRKRLGGGGAGFTASPVAADGKVYFTSEEGDIYVVNAGPQFKLLATNTMGEVCMATPAISEGTLFFRMQHHLVAVAGK